jgi:hypothetical protein
MIQDIEAILVDVPTVADDVAHVLAIKRALGHAVSVRVATVAHLAGR